MPKATVAAIIVDESKENILLTRRNIPPFRNHWCLPGGHIDDDEPVLEAVVREVREETGLTYSPTFYRYFDEIIPDKGMHAVVLTFVGPATGQLDRQVNEVVEVSWFTLPEAQTLPMAFQHDQILRHYIQNQSG